MATRGEFSVSRFRKNAGAFIKLLKLPSADRHKLSIAEPPGNSKEVLAFFTGIASALRWPTTTARSGFVQGQCGRIRQVALRQLAKLGLTDIESRIRRFLFASGWANHAPGSGSR